MDLPASNIFLSPSAAYAPLHSQEGGETGRENRIDSREGAFPMGQLDALLIPKYFFNKLNWNMNKRKRFVKIKIKRSVVFTRQHNKPGHIWSDLVDHIAQGDKVPCPF